MKVFISLIFIGISNFILVQIEKGGKKCYEGNLKSGQKYIEWQCGKTPGVVDCNAKIEFEKITELNGTKGRHLYLTIDNSNIKANYRMYFKDGVFLYLTVLTNEDHLFNKSINKFFGSFKI